MPLSVKTSVGGLAAALAQHFERDFALVRRFEVEARADGVHAVLQQFAQEDLRPAVQVIGQQVDDAAQVDLELVIHGAILGFGRIAQHFISSNLTRRISLRRGS